MEEFKNIRNILWDFDGVILDSMDVRGKGFREVLSEYSKQEVEELLSYHKKNGGLSRYIKFRYFFKEIRHKDVEDQVVLKFARKYSEIMRKELTSSERLINEVTEFIKKNHKNYRMHIVSGSDGEELRYLCDELDLTSFFISIEGSPTTKPVLVEGIIEKYSYSREKTCLIGDSINDYDAAKANSIEFFAYNNDHLKKKGLNYIDSFR